MIQAVIFDLDGTVLDNEGKWETAFKAVVTSNQLSVNSGKNGWIHEPGVGVQANWEKIAGKGEQAKKLARETIKLYGQEDDGVLVMDGLVEAVEAAKEMGYLTALATGSDWNVVAKELEQLDLYLAFDVTTTGEEVALQKPDPEIYRLTVQKLGVEAEATIVLEDSLAGVKSGAAAGCIVVGLTSVYANRKQLFRAGAKYVVDNLGEVVVLLREYGDKSKS